jgi:hypothetical protein
VGGGNLFSRLSVGDRARSRAASPIAIELVSQISGNHPAAISFMRLKFVASNGKTQMWN